MAKVLVVDDEKLIVKGIRFSLEQDGFEVPAPMTGRKRFRWRRRRSMIWFFWT